MKPITLLPLLSLLALPYLTTAASDFQNEVTCGRRFPRISQAIDIFCNKQDGHGQPSNDLVIPSAYASSGVETTGTKGNKLKVWITGTCAPPQWVPALWCRAQFFQMCAETRDPRGWAGFKFGNNNCQFWRINTRTDDAVQRAARPFKLWGT